MSKFTDKLWSDLARDHGPTLARVDRPKPGRAGGGRMLRRPRLLAGSTLGLAGVGVALVLVLGGSSAPPAFAVTRHHDGSVAVKIYRKSGVVGANRKLAAMGIHERLFTVYGSVSPSSKTSKSLSAKSSLPQSCLKDQQTGGVVDVIFPSAAAQQAEVGNGTYTAPSTAGNTGGVPNNGPWHVVACPSISTSTGSGNTGAG